MHVPEVVLKDYGINHVWDTGVNPHFTELNCQYDLQFDLVDACLVGTYYP